jgi:hypothetical protein
MPSRSVSASGRRSSCPSAALALDQQARNPEARDRRPRQAQDGRDLVRRQEGLDVPVGARLRASVDRVRVGLHEKCGRDGARLRKHCSRAPQRVDRGARFLRDVRRDRGRDVRSVGEDRWQLSSDPSAPSIGSIAGLDTTRPLTGAGRRWKNALADPSVPPCGHSSRRCAVLQAGGKGPPDAY